MYSPEFFRRNFFEVRFPELPSFSRSGHRYLSKSPFDSGIDRLFFALRGNEVVSSNFQENSLQAATTLFLYKP